MELFDIALAAPVFPATLLLCTMLGWAAMVLLGTVDFNHVLHLPHSEIDLPDGGTGHLDDGGLGHEIAESSKVGLSVLGLRWLNLGGVPIIVWACTFSLIWWTISAVSWSAIDRGIWPEPGPLVIGLLAARNLVLGLLVTKLVTQPMKTAFKYGKSSTIPEQLIGRECVISSSEATPDFGLVKFPTGGAPLLLNVRTDGQHLPKGTPVWITHYDATRRVYIVSPTTTRLTDVTESTSETKK